MKKLLIVASISVAGLLSAKDGSTFINSNENQNSKKIEIKESTTSLTLMIAPSPKCYVCNEKTGIVVEVPCPGTIIV